MLWKHEQANHGLTSAQVDEIAEEILLNATQMDVDFEIHDGLGKLARLGLAEVDSDGLWRATPIQDSLKSLDASWWELLSRRSGIGAGKTDGQDEAMN